MQSSAAAETLVRNQENLARVRAGLYRLLGLTYLHPPTRSMVETWADPALHAELEGIFSKKLCGSLRRIFQEEKDHAREIKLAYDGLFSVPRKGRCVIPHESFYREEYEFNGKPRKMLMGLTTQAVIQFMKDAGFDPPLEAKELPDHIGMEFLFMSALCREEAEAWQRNREEEAKDWRQRQSFFLAEHIAKWINPLVEDIQKMKAHPFLDITAGMMRELVEKDLELLGT